MKLYETINAENWCRVHVIAPDGRRCLMGHLITSPDYRFEQYHHIVSVLNLLYPKRAMGTIACFNDHPDTTVEDVIRVCKVADV